MTPNDTVSTDDKTEGKGRLGGFLPTLISFAIGAALGAAAALMPAQWVAVILLMKAEQATVLDTLDARVALIVAVAALAAFVGVALDVLHTAESAGVNLFVRCTALVAGSTALIGALIAIPRALQDSFNFATVGILTIVVVALFIIGAVRNARRAHGLGDSAKQ